MSRIHLLARDNGAGLSRDLEILAGVLADAGFDIVVSAIGAGGWRRQARWLRVSSSLAWRSLRLGAQHARFDVNLMLEQIWPKFLPLARRNALIPNPDWFRPEYEAHLPAIDRVLVKTRHAVPLFEARNCRTEFVGFTSVDRLRADVAREPSFFHLAGRSGNKGTRLLIDLWQRKPHWPTLTIVQREKLKLPPKPIANLAFRTEYLGEEALCELANRHLFHLCPSETEGFGHNLCEGMSTGPVMLTTDAPPMNELVTAERGILIPYASTGTQRLATTYFVSAETLETAVEQALALTQAQRRTFAENARAWYERNDVDFKRRIAAAVADLAAA